MSEESPIGPQTQPATPHVLPQTIAAILQEDGQPVLPAAAAIFRPKPTPFYAYLILIPILLMAGYFRFTGINWDDFTHLHPDERFLTMVGSAVSVTDPLNYLNTAESTLNPYNINNGDGSRRFPLYVYGNFPMTVTRYVAELAQSVCNNRAEGCELFGRNTVFVGYDGIHFIGRILSGTLDLISVFFIFLIGKRLYDWRVGLLAALLLGASVLPIQQAHFFTADNWAAALTTVAVYCAVRASERNSTLWHALFGVVLGLVVASRINVAPLALLAGIAAIIWLNRHIPNWQALRTSRGFDYVMRAIFGVIVAAFASMIVFRLTMPYAFAGRTLVREQARQELEQETGQPVSIDEINPNNPIIILRGIVGFNPHWLDNMEEIQRLQEPDAVFPPALQWTNRTPLVMPFTNMVLWGMGIFAGLAAWMGCLWALSRIGRGLPDWLQHAIPVVWSLLYFLFIGSRWVKSVRYFLPIYPTLLLLGAWALIELYKRADRQPLQRLLAVGAIGVVSIGTVLYANAFMTVYTDPMTRLTATDWFYENVPSGATLLYTGADGTAKEFQLPLRNHVFQQGQTPLNLYFELPEDGTITGVRFNYLVEEQTSDQPPRLYLQLRAPDLPEPLVAVDAGLNVPERRSAATIGFEGVSISAGQPLQLSAEMTSGGTLIAETSILMNEHWDDALPTRYGGRDPFGQYYEGLNDPISGFNGQAPITWPDDDNKREGFIRWLDSADYIVLSSQRAVWSTPRLPLTYPLTEHYYEQLFAGNLGFEQVAQIQADLHVGPFYWSDVGGKFSFGSPPEFGWPPPSDLLSAEEAFSVYDHPPVWIFKKADGYDSAETRRIFEQVNLNQTMFMNPGQATNAPTALQFSDSEFDALQTGGTFTDLYNPDSVLNQNPAIAAVVWWVATILLGWIGFPIAFSVFSSLPTRGYVLSRIMSMLLVSYFGWLMASIGILQNTRSTYMLGVALLAVLSVYQIIRNRTVIIDFIQRNVTLFALVELIGIVLFGIAIYVRLGNPDLWDQYWGGENQWT